MCDRRANEAWTVVRRRRGRAMFRDPPAAIRPVSHRVSYPSYPYWDPISRTAASYTGYREQAFNHPAPRGRGHDGWGRHPVDRDPHPNHRYDDRRSRSPGSRGPVRTHDRTPHQVQHDRGHPPPRGDRGHPPPRGNRRRRRRPEVASAPCHRYEEERGPRSSDPDFSAKNKIIYSVIKALHHLDNVTCPVPPVTITRMVRLLTQVIKPAAPNSATLSLIHGNAENWAYTTTIILRDHYRENLENQVRLFSLLPGPEWQQNYEIASAWARRHFGPRLLQGTLDEAHARLCHTRDTVGLLTDPLPGRTPLARTPPRPTDPVPVTAQVHAPRDGGRLLVTPPSPPIGPSINAVQREGGSPEPQPDVEDGPSPVVPPVSFFPSLSGPDTPPTPPMVQRTTRPLSRPTGRPKQPALTSRPAPPDAARAVDEATSADSSPGDIHGPMDLSGSRPATPREQIQSRLMFFPPAASTSVTPTRRSNRHVNTNTNVNNPRLSITRRRHIQRVWKECLGT